MELMDISLDKFYRFSHQRLQQKIPESILGKIALAVRAANRHKTLAFRLPLLLFTDCSSLELFEGELGNYSS